MGYPNMADLEAVCRNAQVVVDLSRLLQVSDKL